MCKGVQYPGSGLVGFGLLFSAGIPLSWWVLRFVCVIRYFELRNLALLRLSYEREGQKEGGGGVGVGEREIKGEGERILRCESWGWGSYRHRYQGAWEITW